ncbi:L-fuculose-phosphate aldolase [Fictibacillus barbaricus]|uniref:L-fuculose-phosphate aldolase n=1 Tax=Fictibacillus barbaricus TaxID=182136 RepID=A0ABU1U184_9BACL|nr:L-fuculose-phosphate aldolase [Fictibacillus barbaricus]MDR7073215.1 L-fuculose-phosphate aldolase [Fictibacillus barbaricus]
MLLQNEREQVVYYCQQMVKRGLTKGTGGNISIFNRESRLIAISPSGIDYDVMTAEDVVVVNLDGEVVDGNCKPSSELSMHAIYYKRRDDINAVVHTHSPFATTISAMRWDLPAVSYLVAHAGRDVRCAEYASFGTPELAENAFKAMENRKAVLLANHGFLSGAQDIANAFNIAEEIEFCCEIYYRTKCVGEPIILDDEEMELMTEKFKEYGQKTTS